MKNIFKNLFNSFFQSNDHIKEEKDDLRTYIHLMKKELTEEKKKLAAEQVFSKIEALPAFQQVKTVLFYTSIGNELPTHDYLKKWSAEKLILLPSVKDHEIHIKKYVPKEKMERGVLKILEPKTDVDKDKIELAILPGIAFDKSRNRMGRGKGYYDKYLKRHKIRTIGVGYDFQLLEQIPTRPKDVKMEMIITPSVTI